ncbi:MAG: hypothetical protein OXD29_14245, partial [Roseovarius sp.]|nr:hypothetical protein [Roseovarius sp.]
RPKARFPVLSISRPSASLPFCWPLATAAGEQCHASERNDIACFKSYTNTPSNSFLSFRAWQVGGGLAIKNANLSGSYLMMGESLAVWFWFEKIAPYIHMESVLLVLFYLFPTT